ncbi:unnamed protein product [Rhizophagus irregularis]|nr:unnamed protein product [Rhizophagus irregularis]
MDYKIQPEMDGFFIYLFVIGEIVDSYLNRNITPIERIRMAMTARELAEFLGMIQPSTLLINNNTPTIFIDINDKENLHDNDESELSDDCEIDLSTAINKASSEIQKINEQLEENLENEKIFNDCYSQIQLLDKMTVMSILNGGDSVNNEFKYFINNDLNFESLINQRKLHEAYCSKPLERRFKPFQILRMQT